MESFFKSVVSPSSERAHRAGSSSEETSSFHKTSSVEEESSLSILLSLPLARRFFDVTVDTSDCLVKRPVYMESPASIPRGAHDCSMKTCDASSSNGHNIDEHLITSILPISAMGIVATGNADIINIH
jgi:hypothetical protein